MDDATRLAWKQAANDLLRDGIGRPTLHGSAPSASVGLTKVLARLKPGFGWPEARRAIVDHWMGNNAWAFGPHRVNVMKSVRLGYAMATGDASVATPSEAAFLAAKGFRVPVAPPAAVDLPAGDRFHVDFAVVYQGTLPGTRKPAPSVGRGAVTVERVDEDATVAAWSLPIPNTDRALVVREFRGDLYRPVLKPGSWDLASEVDFVGACQGREPWADDPFGPRRGCSPVAPHEYADELPLARKSDEKAMTEAVEKALVQSGTFLSIGGVVHRRTEEPVMALVTKGSTGREHVLAWRVRGLYSTDDMSSLRDASEAQQADTTCCYDHVEEPIYPGLPASLVEETRAIVQRVSEAMDVRLVQHDFPVPLAGQPRPDAVTAIAERLGSLPDVVPANRYRGPMQDPYVETAKGVAEMVRSGKAEDLDDYVGSRRVMWTNAPEDRYLRVSMTKAMVAVAVEASLRPTVAIAAPEEDEDETLVAGMGF